VMQQGGGLKRGGGGGWGGWGGMLGGVGVYGAVLLPGGGGWVVCVGEAGGAEREVIAGGARVSRWTHAG